MRGYTHQDSKHDSGNGAANEAFPGLLRRQFDERRATEEEAKHIRHDVVADDHRHRNQEPARKDKLCSTR